MKIKKVLKKFKTLYKNGKKNKKFDDTEIKKYKFHQNKSTISIYDIDINKIVVSNKLPFSKQDFIYSLATKMIKN